MAVEIEKKYRLSELEQKRLRARLIEIAADLRGEEFEENTLYAGNNLDAQTSVLRLRRTSRSATLTYKERFPSDSAIKRQREDETRIEDPDALHSILDALGYKPALVYEKRRETWRLRMDKTKIEIVIDKLPFGLFAEIEGEENAIIEVEQKLSLTDAEAEFDTYPELTRKFGMRRADIIEARFS